MTQVDLAPLRGAVGGESARLFEIQKEIESLPLTPAETIIIKAVLMEIYKNMAEVMYHLESVERRLAS